MGVVWVGAGWRRGRATWMLAALISLMGALSSAPDRAMAELPADPVAYFDQRKAEGTPVTQALRRGRARLDRRLGPLGSPVSHAVLISARNGATARAPSMIAVAKKWNGTIGVFHPGTVSRTW